MLELEKLYGDDLLMVYDSSKLIDSTYSCMAVIRSNVEKKTLEGVLTYNYDEDFESMLAYKVPPKTRKPAKLLSYTKALEVIDKVAFASIGCVIDDMPYTYGMNYVMLDGHIYFHTGRRGYKLNAIGTKASVNIVEDLGMAYNGTHNFRSIQIYGTLKQTEDWDLKKAIFLKYIDHLNKNHPPYVDSMQQTTLVYEIEMDYMLARENLFMPGDGK